MGKGTRTIPVSSRVKLLLRLSGYLDEETSCWVYENQRLGVSEYGETRQEALERFVEAVRIVLEDVVRYWKFPALRERGFQIEEIPVGEGGPELTEYRIIDPDLHQSSVRQLELASDLDEEVKASEQTREEWIIEMPFKGEFQGLAKPRARIVRELA